MGKDSKTNCKVASHQLLKDKAKNRVDDLQLMINQLQVARQQSRDVDVSILEAQVDLVLREWKAELNEPTPVSSLHEGSLGSFPSELGRLLREFEEADDATSALAEPIVFGADSHTFTAGHSADFKEVFHFNDPAHQFHVQDLQQDTASYLQQPLDNNMEPSDLHNSINYNLENMTHLDYLQFDNELYVCPSNMEHHGVNALSDISGVRQNILPPPSAFLGPKCALWDCARPVQDGEQGKDYCSAFHAELAKKEGPPGMAPILRPGGIDLKDGPLLSALRAKMQAKNVGIPVCEGAATARSPWNAPELFDISFIEGETMREWLFFDKPRRAFERGNRKQRSLPDYHGRGWHESRKQVLKDFGGWKRSYYMDPQPVNDYEWHMFEYEIENCCSLALYRLELKKAVDGKKSPKGKVATDSLADLQNRMGRLTAESPSPVEIKHAGKGKAKGVQKCEPGSINSTVNTDSSSCAEYRVSSCPAEQEDKQVFSKYHT